MSPEQIDQFNKVIQAHKKTDNGNLAWDSIKDIFNNSTKSMLGMYAIMVDTGIIIPTNTSSRITRLNGSKIELDTYEKYSKSLRKSLKHDFKVALMAAGFSLLVGWLSWLLTTRPDNQRESQQETRLQALSDSLKNLYTNLKDSSIYGR